MPEPPPNARTSVVESGDRLVLAIPPGGARTRTLGAFAVVWNAIAWVLFGVFALVAANVAPADRWTAFAAAGFAGLFPLAGLGLAYWWSRLRFTRTLVFVEPPAGDRPGTAAVKTIWFGRERVRETPLAPGDRAELDAAYQDDDEPVLRVKVGPGDDAVHFGEAMDDAELRWICGLVNRTLRVERPHDLGPDGPDAPPRTDPAEPRATADDPRITVLRDGVGEFILRVPAWPPSSGRRVFLGFWCVFTAVWWWFVGWMLWDELGPLLAAGGGRRMDPIDWLFVPRFCVPFVLAGFAMLTVLAAVPRGTVTTTVDAGAVTVRWGVGLLRHTRRLPVDTIDEVVVWRNFSSSRTNGGPTKVEPAAALRRGDSLVPLTLIGDTALAENVAGLVWDRLERIVPTP